jgi:hypothetical protein
MAQSPQPQPPRTKWLWVAVIVVLAVLLTIMLFNPSGDRDGAVEDPIAMPDTGEGVGLGQNDDPEESSDIPAPEPFAPGGDPAN